MSKVKGDIETNELTREDYQKLIENLRVRLNVLNASVFLLEEKLITVDKGTLNYLEKINTELEIIRQLILPYPFQIHHKN
jgi:hypothetical protein